MALNLLIAPAHKGKNIIYAIHCMASAAATIVVAKHSSMQIIVS